MRELVRYLSDQVQNKKLNYDREKQIVEAMHLEASRRPWESILLNFLQIGPLGHKNMFAMLAAFLTPFDVFRQNAACSHTRAFSRKDSMEYFMESIPSITTGFERRISFIAAINAFIEAEFAAHAMMGSNVSK